MRINDALPKVQKFVHLMVAENVATREQYTPWAKTQLETLEKLFGYSQKTGMPAVYSLIEPCFHENLPLILINYTPSATNVLHTIKDGWTPFLRTCRGIVFDKQGNLIAFGFPKFFNLGENKDSQTPPKGKLIKMKKMDGHLGIIFKHEGKWIATTRGKFNSNTSIRAQQKLNQLIAKKQWDIPEGITLIVEYICPETRVLTDYGDTDEFILLSVFDVKKVKRYTRKQMLEIAEKTNLAPVAEYRGSFNQLLKEKDTLKGEEGFVCWSQKTDEFIKVKCPDYLNRMIKDKLGKNAWGYLIGKIMSGGLHRTLEIADEEVQMEIARMSALLHEATDRLTIESTGEEKNAAAEKIWALEKNPIKTHIDKCKKYVNWVIQQKTAQQ